MSASEHAIDPDDATDDAGRGRCVVRLKRPSTKNHHPGCPRLLGINKAQGATRDRVSAGDVCPMGRRPTSRVRHHAR